MRFRRQWRPKQTFSVLDSFQNFPHGASPYAPLYRDASGNLYGTTAYGGNKSNEYLDGSGVVFKLDANGRETVLHNFTGGLDGGNPYAGVVMDSAGNLYGTTFQGGTGQGQLGSGAGVVFKIDWSGRYSVLYRFTGGADGSGPASNLILDAAGYLYGTTAGGGPQNYGVVFKVSQSGQETVLYGFTDGSEGVYPSGVTADAAGNLYGTTLEGGEYGTGAVFKLSRSGQVTVLHTFGQYGRPSGVILDAAGSLYGGAQDLIYKLDPAGNLTALAEFDGVPSELVRDTSGNLYFTSGAPGSVYKLETNGNLKSYTVSRGLL